MEQQSLFDPQASEVLKREAIAQVSANADEDWKTAALAAVKHVSRSLVEFTTDDVWLELGAEHLTHDNRAMGAVMREAAAAGWCRVTDRVQKSVRRVCHRRPLAVWESKF